MNRFQTPNNRFTGGRTATRKYVKYVSGFEELFDPASPIRTSFTTRRGG